jgi:hypothetical protein
VQAGDHRGRRGHGMLRRSPFGVTAWHGRECARRGARAELFAGQLATFCWWRPHAIFFGGEYPDVNVRSELPARRQEHPGRGLQFEGEWLSVPRLHRGWCCCAHRAEQDSTRLRCHDNRATNRGAAGTYTDTHTHKHTHTHTHTHTHIHTHTQTRSVSAFPG